MREEEVADKSRNIHVILTFCHSGSDAQRRHFCGTCKRTEIEEHVVTDLDA